MADGFGYTALIWAAEKGHLDVAQLLLDRGAAIDKTANTGSTALIEAAKKGHLDVARLLLDRGAELDKDNCFGWSALMQASVPTNQNNYLYQAQHLDPAIIGQHPNGLSLQPLSMPYYQY
jgi:ankyrin repeat protein